MPESARVAESVPRSDKLSHSLRLISEALKSGRINEQFEQLYRKKAGMSMNECRQPQNMNKNRYRAPGSPTPTLADTETCAPTTRPESSSTPPLPETTSTPILST